jgi:hypothetical protein
MARDGELAVKKKFSAEQIATNPRQAEVGIPGAGSVLIRFKALAAKSASLYLILCIVFNLWINREHAAYIAQRGASLAHEFPSKGFEENRSLTNGGNGILENVGLAVFVSGLSPCLLRDSLKQPLPDECAGLRESGEYPPAGEQRRLPHLLGRCFVDGQALNFRKLLWMTTPEGGVLELKP